jgi:hypothetical protein
MSIQSSRTLHIPTNGTDAMHMDGVSYVRAQGSALLQYVDIQSYKDKSFYTSQTYERVSQDNGKSFTERNLEACAKSEDLGEAEQVLGASLVLDEKRDLLFRFRRSQKGCYRAGDDHFWNLMMSTRKSWYQISRDGGDTWGELKQIIDSRPGFDGDNWSAVTQYGKNGAVPTDFTFNEEGDVIAAFSLYNYHAMKEGALSYAVVYARGTWKESDGEFDWTFGDVVELPPDVSSYGCIEPCTVSLGGGRLANAMRCQGDASRGIYSLRYVTHSEDSGRTWSEPAPLCYDDGSTVWNPAAYASFFRSSKTGKVYFVSNILDEPVYRQAPRYRLAIAEFDSDRMCLVRDSVHIIQEKPDDAPAARRYSNWSKYEDRETQELVLLLAEEPRYKNYADFSEPKDMAADLYEYRLSF